MIVVDRFPNYGVTEDGRVKNLKRDKFLKPRFYKKTGYNYIILYGGKGPKSRTIHRLVAEAYIPNPLKKPWVNHKDGNKLNNHVSNLEWATKKENSQHAHQRGLINNAKGEEHWNSRLTQDQIMEIRENKDKLTNKALGTKYGVTKNYISRVRRNKRWTNKGVDGNTNAKGNLE